MNEYKANLLVKRMGTGEIVQKIGLHSLDDRYVEKITMGLLRNMDLDRFFIDDSEVREARNNEAAK